MNIIVVDDEKIMAAENDRENGRKTNIIFVTAYSEYATDAFDLFASGYLIKAPEISWLLTCNMS